MGSNKALLEFGGRPLIGYSIELAVSMTSDIFIIDNSHDLDGQGYPVVQDIFPVGAPLAGIHAGLTVSPNPWNLVLTCDMPYVSPELIRYLISQLPALEKILVPRHDGFSEPLCGFWHRDVLPEVEDLLNAGKYSPLELIRDYPERMADISGNSQFDPIVLFRNINTPGDLLAC